MYFRFNPFMDGAFIDEYRPERLEQYKEAAHEYMAAHAERVDECGRKLRHGRDLLNYVQDWLWARHFGRAMLRRVRRVARNLV